MVEKRDADRKETAAPEMRAESFDFLWDETRDHLFPWGRIFAKRSRAAQALALAFAFAVTVAWILGILGHLRPRVVLGWWAAWSVFEIVARVKCQPWFRHGRALRRLREPATVGQIVVYVTAKNILIGAFLFLLMVLIGHPDLSFR